MQKRELSIDILKIIAMFTVAYYHACDSALFYGYTEGADEYIPNLARVVMNLCSVGVPLFFMCSGYCTLSSPSSDWKKMGRKIITIIVLTLIWNYLTPFPIWFFITLSALYFITPVLRKARQLSARLYWGAIACIFLGTFVLNDIYVVSRLFAPNVMDHYAIQGLFTSYSIVYYALGSRLKERNIPAVLALASLGIGFALSLAECSIMTVWTGKMIDGVNGSFNMFSTLLMTLGIFSLAIRIETAGANVLSKGLAAISSGCLSVYIFHMFFIRETHSTLYQIFLVNITEYRIITGFVYTVLICALSWALGMLIRRIPYVCYLMKL